MKGIGILRATPKASQSTKRPKRSNLLGGGCKYFLFSPLPGAKIQFPWKKRPEKGFGSEIP